MLESNASPTQQRSKSQFQLAEFTAQIMDNNEQEHSVNVEYEFTPYWDGISVWSFDYTPERLSNLSDRDYCNEIKELIRRNANCTVTFY